ncbi:hypothetical protein SARC_08294 [Sphaeroforma arctica JP610]|uniref:Amino acid transporter transmembrane domain-containing protein n=1 Tax=Sphaeroforma arctica JP610 TaxID=667725 RepID=A0A0L0FRW0_9EUKA|nr:hypothetical protein SARC_08294 [Sphaeroforma arctica JP610]KNC79311.1 hypothetical protein SARC_08294 [Sphaeroforma arctica JP610]|eukprot:XP_014153213.1 hypothetical protein SARC_08294 [Sphaeroforma arctica JP610]
MDSTRSGSEDTRPLLVSQGSLVSEDRYSSENILLYKSGGSGQIATSVNLIKIGLGTGVLTLGFGAHVAGVVGCAAILALVATLNVWSIYLLVQCEKTIAPRLNPHERNPRGKYSQIAYEAFGNYGVWLTDFFVVLTLMGAATAYFVFVETTMVHVVPGYPAWFWVMVSYPVCILLVLPDDLRYLAPVSIVAIFSTVIGMCAVFAYGATQQTFQIPEDAWFRPKGLPQCFGLCVYTFGHPVIIFPIYDQMKDRTTKFMPTVSVSLSMLVVCFAFVGLLSVGFFESVGVMQNSIAQLPSGSVASKIVQTAMSIVILLSYPLTMFVVNKMVFQYVSVWVGTADPKLDYFVRIVLVSVAATGALIFPHLADVVTILGCFTITYLCFVNPMGFYYTLHKDTLSGIQKALLGFGGVLGLCTILYTTHSAVVAMLNRKV